MYSRLVIPLISVLLSFSCQATRDVPAGQELEQPADQQVQETDEGSSIAAVQGEDFAEFGREPLKRVRPAGLPSVIKNFRVVLDGALYRGGVEGTRGLNAAELKQLCELGFSYAVYFYDKGFKEQTVKCTDRSGKQNSISYVLRPTVGQDGLKKLMKEISSNINGSKGPTYIHCHNGWHATGIASAIAARQFCGVNTAKANKYLEITTDGSFKTIEGWGPKKVAGFPMDSALTLKGELREKYCQGLDAMDL